MQSFTNYLIQTSPQTIYQFATDTLAGKKLAEQCQSEAYNHFDSVKVQPNGLSQTLIICK